MALGASKEIIRELTGEWLVQETDDDFIEYEYDDIKLDMYLNWPGADNQIPRPLDLLLIFIQEKTDVEVLRPIYQGFKNVVFKAVLDFTGH